MREIYISSSCEIHAHFVGFGRMLRQFSHLFAIYESSCLLAVSVCSGFFNTFLVYGVVLLLLFIDWFKSQQGRPLFVGKLFL